MQIAVQHIQTPSLALVGIPPGVARAGLVGVAAIGFAMGFQATDIGSSTRALAEAGPELTMLLRAMAGLKAGMALAVTSVILWRVGSPASAPRIIAYATAIVLMAAGPGLIWTLAHVGLGAAMLHGGLLMAIVLLWRDRAVGERLGTIVSARRAAVRAG